MLLSICDPFALEAAEQSCGANCKQGRPNSDCDKSKARDKPPHRCCNCVATSCHFDLLCAAQMNNIPFDSRGILPVQWDTVGVRQCCPTSSEIKFSTRRCQAVFIIQKSRRASSASILPKPSNIVKPRSHHPAPASS